MNRITNTEALARFKAILQDKGIRQGLIYLNGLTAHRFTALYRFDGDMLQNMHLYDRQDPVVESSLEIPVMASYCVFVRDSGRPFALHDSLADDRVAGHPKRQQVQSYCGVPLLDEDGRMFGTICHFDLRPLPIHQADVELMEMIAPLLWQRAGIDPGIR